MTRNSDSHTVTHVHEHAHAHTHTYTHTYTHTHTHKHTHTPQKLPSAHWVESPWNRCIEYWTICSCACLFACTAHSFAHFSIPALLAQSAVLICSLTRLLKRGFCLYNERMDFIQFQPIVRCHDEEGQRKGHTHMHAHACSNTHVHTHAHTHTHTFTHTHTQRHGSNW